jgi:hypothetical protein
MKPTSREARLTLLMATTAVSEERRTEIREIVSHALDWEHLMWLAERHGLAPLFERHLNAVAPERVPKSILARLWARAEARSRRNAAMAAELCAIVRLLDEEGIHSVPYKGPTLALLAYGDLALREFGDLDLLVRARDVRRAREALEQRGYSMRQPLTAEQEGALVASSLLYELPLVDTARRQMVELHWREDPDVAVLPLGDDAWWQSLATIEIAGRNVNALSNAELLLALCLHGTKHFWSSLGWLVDVAELLRCDPDLDAPWIREASRSHGCERRVGVGLRLAADVLGAPVPPALMPLIEDGVVRDVAALIAEGLFMEYKAPTIVEALRLNLRLRDSTRQRIAYAWKTAMTPGWGEWLEWRLPRRLFFLYRLLRPLRLLRKYVFTTRFPRTPAAATPRTPPPRPRSTS